MAGHVAVSVNHGVAADYIRLIFPWADGSFTIVTDVGDVYHAADIHTAAVLQTSLGWDVVTAVVAKDPEVATVPFEVLSMYLLRRDTGMVYQYDFSASPTFALNTTFAKDATVVGLPLSLMRRTSDGVILLGTSAGEVCPITVDPYVANVGITDDCLLGAEGYYSAGGCFSDASDMRLACGLSVIIPANDLLTFTDHDSPISDTDTDAPGTEYIVGYARGATHDVAGFVSYWGNIEARIYQKLFASGAWTLAHTFPSGSESFAANFFYGSVSGDILCWLGPTFGSFGDYAYSTDDGVSWTDDTIDPDCAEIYAMADDGAGTYYAIISNSNSGDIELWSAAAVSGPWAFLATITAEQNDTRAVIDLANSVMHVFDAGDFWNDSAPYTSWTNVGSTTSTDIVALFRAAGAGRLAAVFENTIEETDDDGATWTEHTFTLLDADEAFICGFPDNRAGASQEAFAVTNYGRIVTGAMTLAAWSDPPASVSGDGLRLGIMDGAGSDAGAMAYVMACVPYDYSNGTGDAQFYATRYNELVVLSTAGAGVNQSEQFIGDGGNVTRFGLAAPCIRPGGVPASRGAMVGVGNEVLVFTNSSLAAYVSFSIPSDPFDYAQVVASQNGVYLVQSNQQDLYASVDGSTYEDAGDPGFLHIDGRAAS